MQEKLDLKNQNSLRKRISELENSSLMTNTDSGILIKNLREQLKIKKVEFDNRESLLIKENNVLLTNFKDMEKKINDVSIFW